jgi:hypothetical protein
MNSVTGNEHNFTLMVMVDDSMVNYSVMAEINCTRIDTFGGIYGNQSIFIPLKASPKNYFKMDIKNPKKTASPKSLLYFYVDITNKGYYKDVFQFEIESENGLLALFEEQAAVINPRETRELRIGVLTPEKILDFGTPNNIHLYIYILLVIPQKH